MIWVNIMPRSRREPPLTYLDECIIFERHVIEEKRAERHRKRAAAAARQQPDVTIQREF